MTNFFYERLEDYNRQSKGEKDHKYWSEFYFKQFQKESKKLLKYKNVKTLIKHTQRIKSHLSQMEHHSEMHRIYKGWAEMSKESMEEERKKLK